MIYANDNSQIAIIFGFLSVFIFFTTLYTIISRWFYAHKDTKTPLFVSIFTILLNVLLAYKLARPSTYGVSGLALAQSTVAMVEVFLLFGIMLYRDPKLFDRSFWSGIIKIISVTGFSLIAGFVMVSFYPLGINDHGFITLGTKLALIAGVTFLVHFGVSLLFGLEEARPVLDKIKKIILKPIRTEY